MSSIVVIAHHHRTIRQSAARVLDRGGRVRDDVCMRGPLGFFAPGPARERIEDPDRVAALYKRYQLSIMATLVATYGFFYTARLPLSVVKKPLIDEGIFTPVELGWIGAAFFWGYAAGKLINGFLADRVNVRRFIPFGLAVSACINIAMGFNSVAMVAVVLWLFNGWFQGFGAPACVVSITQWFSSRQRGSVYGVWSSAHSIGEGLTFIGTAALVSATMWRAAFLGPGIWCIAVAIAAYFGLRDRPETVGLPPVAEYTGHPGDDQVKQKGWALFKAQLSLLRIPAIWVIGLASATMYVTRYAINSWGVLYLEEAHGFSTTTAGTLVGLNAIVGIFGCIAYGVLSDRLFKSRRPPLTLIFGVLEIVALVIIFYAPTGDKLIVGAGFVLYGFTLSGILAVLGGLFAVDIAPRNATGAAMGVIGVFSYAGAAIQDAVSGYLIARGTTVVDEANHYDFSTPIMFWIGASVVSAVLAASLWRVKSSD
jgi:OPA family sugar phosphate sensor protein UhpC-like MFS transporter